MITCFNCPVTFVVLFLVDFSPELIIVCHHPECAENFRFTSLFWPGILFLFFGYFFHASSSILSAFITQFIYIYNYIHIYILGPWSSSHWLYARARTWTFAFYWSMLTNGIHKYDFSLTSLLDGLFAEASAFQAEINTAWNCGRNTSYHRSKVWIVNAGF